LMLHEGPLLNFSLMSESSIREIYMLLVVSRDKLTPPCPFCQCKTMEYLYLLVLGDTAGACPERIL
jgi:hypothetical protein